jgi:hypothetical protein
VLSLRWHLDWQVSSVAQFSNALSQVFSAVEHLTLKHEVHIQSSELEEHNDVDRSFSNVKTHVFSPMFFCGGLIASPDSVFARFTLTDPTSMTLPKLDHGRDPDAAGQNS